MPRYPSWWVKDPNGQNIVSNSAQSTDTVFTCIFCRHTFHTRYYKVHIGSDSCIDTIYKSRPVEGMVRRYVYHVNTVDLAPGAKLHQRNLEVPFLRAFAAYGQVYRVNYSRYSCRELWYVFPFIKYEMKSWSIEQLAYIQNSKYFEHTNVVNHGLLVYENISTKALELLEAGVTDMDLAVELVKPHVESIINKALLSILTF